MSKDQVVKFLKEMRIKSEHYYSKEEHNILRTAIECLSGTAYQSPECKCEVIEGLNDFLADEMLISDEETKIVKLASNFIFESMIKED